jgi:hypothetical protein
MTTTDAARRRRRRGSARLAFRLVVLVVAAAAAAAIAALAAGAAAPSPAHAAEPPQLQPQPQRLGTKNFTAPPYVPDYFSNESGPFHTGAGASARVASPEAGRDYVAPAVASGARAIGAGAASRRLAKMAHRHGRLRHVVHARQVGRAGHRYAAAIAVRHIAHSSPHRRHLLSRHTRPVAAAHRPVPARPVVHRHVARTG